MNLSTELNERRMYVDTKLDEYLPKECEYPEIIFKSMRYSVFAGGKRIRPIMLLAVNRMFGGSDDIAAPYACALEMIHTYSLIHDDLPAIDNDNFRRGRLTNHKAFGEDIAILAGDALLTHAFEVMSEAVCKSQDINGVRAMNAIAHGAGVNGMVVGQVVDVISDGKKLNKETLDFIHLNKTGAMIQGAFKAGALLAGATETSVELLDEAAKKIGIAFQIQDDILDVTSTQEELGKPIFSDEKNEKTTYVTLYGVEKSTEFVKQLSYEAMSILQSFGTRCNFLEEMTRYLIDRRF
jgi:Geranylgeranyl pyrophosphate synthase